MSVANLQTIAHYELLEVIGRGSVSTVYKAMDTQAQRIVALKLIHSHLANDPIYERRFLEDGRAIARLEHPNIICITEVSVSAGQPFLVMDYVRGYSLRKRLESRQSENALFDLAEVISIGRQIAEALDYAHAQGVVHGDVKPENILIKDTSSSPRSASPTAAMPQIVLTDFGIARPVDDQESVMGKLLGTLEYMAPEQFEGEPPSSRADIYSLGVVLYEMLTGQQPFEPSSMMDVILMHAVDEPAPISELRSDVPDDLSHLIGQAMAKDPEKRFQLAREAAWGLQIIERSLRPSTPKAIPTIRRPLLDDGPATLYDTLPVLDPPIIPVDLLSEGTNDRLIITSAEGTSWTMPMDKPSMIGGREPTCDLHLDDPRVSRKHFRIDLLPDGQWVIVDLGSLNGLFLGDDKLEKHMIMLWHADRSLKVGPFWLTQRLAKYSEGNQRSLSKPRVLETQIGDQDAILRLIPAHAAAEPGSVTHVRVEIANNTSAPQHYQLSVQGIPESWVTLSFDVLEVWPGQSIERTISLHPPRLPTSLAKSYDYYLVVTCREHADRATSLAASLRIYPYDAFTHSVAFDGKTAQITINNQGNSPRVYVIEAREIRNRLLLLPSRTRLSIQTGTSATAAIRLQAKNRPLFGRPIHCPVELFIRSDGLHPQTPSFDVTITPYFSWRSLAALLLISVILLSIGLIALIKLRVG